MPLSFPSRRRLFRLGAIATILVGILYGAGAAFWEWDPTRAMWKRWNADSPYLYEEIHPRYLRTDPAKLIRLNSPDDVNPIRQALINAVWPSGKLPLGQPPSSVETDVEDARAEGMDNLAGLDRYHVSVAENHDGIGWLFRPRRGNGRLVVFHNGHGGNGSFFDRRFIIDALVGEGYAVLAFNLPGLGGNRLGEAYLPRYGWYALHPWRLFDLVDDPLRYYFEPVIVGISAALQAHDYKSVDMVGFSAGGWMTMVSAALDTRIRRSYPVAGAYPLYLRSGDEAKQSPRPQYYAPLIRAANYLEMFVLAAVDHDAAGETRRQLQVFNRFDRCCYNNIKARHYEPAVRAATAAAGDGRFDVLIDETHARHKVSRFALRAILDDLRRP